MTVGVREQGRVIRSLNCSPNPTRDLIQLEYKLNQAGRIDITLFNLLGQETMKLFKGVKNPGIHHESYNLAELQAGLYFLRISGSDNMITKKIIIR